MNIHQTYRAQKGQPEGQTLPQHLKMNKESWISQKMRAAVATSSETCRGKTRWRGFPWRLLSVRLTSGLSTVQPPPPHPPCTSLQPPASATRSTWVGHVFLLLPGDGRHASEGGSQRWCENGTPGSVHKARCDYGGWIGREAAALGGLCGVTIRILSK